MRLEEVYSHHYFIQCEAFYVVIKVSRARSSRKRRKFVVIVKMYHGSSSHPSPTRVCVSQYVRRKYLI